MAINLSLKDIAKLTPVKSNDWRPISWSGGQGGAIAGILTTFTWNFKIPFPVVDFRLRKVIIQTEILNNGFYVNPNSVANTTYYLQAINGNVFTGLVTDPNGYNVITKGEAVYLTTELTDFNPPLDFDLGQLAGFDFAFNGRILLNAAPVGATYSVSLIILGEYRN